MSRREYPCDPHTMHARNLYAWTQMEALQRAAPFEEPVVARKDLLWIREVIDETAKRVLTPRELWIFDSICVERLSIRKLAHRLGLSRTHTHRLYRLAIDKVRQALLEEWPDGPPEIGGKS